MSEVAPNPTPPAVAVRLAWSGMLPFAAGTLALWLVPPEDAAPWARALTLYAAIIASFMAAIPFGFAVAASQDETVDGAGLGLSVLPALAVWFALLGLPDPAMLAVAAVSFAAIFALDRRALALGQSPAWYARMRLPLTLTVITLLMLGAAALLVRAA